MCAVTGFTLQGLLLHALKLLCITEVAFEICPGFIQCRFGVPFLALKEAHAGFEHLVAGDVQNGGS